MHLALIFITMSHNKKQQIRNLWIFIVVTLLLVVMISSSITLSSVSITPTGERSPVTSDTLNCSWTWPAGNPGVNANVSWYNGTRLILSEYNLTDYSLLNSTYTAKGETWNCTVILGNDTDSSSYMSTTTTIQNSLPEKPFLQYLGNNIGTYIEILENIEYSFIINTSDFDNDTIRYSVSPSSYCTVNNQYVNIVICNATSQPDLSVNDEFGFTVRDGPTGVTSYIDFNITPVNDRPYFSAALNSHSINETNTLTYGFSVTDEENNTGIYYYNISSTYGDDRLNLTAIENAFSIKFENNRAASFIDIGNFTVYINVCDPEDYSLCINDSFVLEVISTNHQPNLSLIQNHSGRQNQRLLFYVNATDLDESNILDFEISGLNCGYDPWNITTLNSSYNASGIVNMTLNNSHILCPNITITINDDQGGSDSQNVYLNLTNEDDTPIIYNLSYSANNSHGNNITSLYGFTNVLFTYQINGTDLDYGFDPYETLTYSDNSSLCGINCPALIISSTGLINQTFTQAGNFSYEINLTDYYLNYTTAIMNLEIMSNAFPYFNHSIVNLTVNETEILEYKMNATDPDGGPINFTDNVEIINITNEGLINHTYSCSDIGNYTVSVTISDEAGAQNTSTFNLEILNKPQYPILPNLGNQTIWEGYSFSRNIRLETTDYDLNEFCSKTDDSLIYTSRFTGPTTLFNISSSGVISSYTPTKAEVGYYEVNITVIDSYGLTSSKLWNLTIGNRSAAPIIINITPHGKPMNLTWALRTDYPTNITYTNTTENTTVYFNHNTTDPEGDPLVFNWTLDGSVVSYEKNYSKYFSFLESGEYNITLTVSDNLTGILENYVKFTWNLTIDNLNRAPALNNSMPNITNISENTLITNYFIRDDYDNVLFNDPDGDTLVYNFSPTSKFNLSYTGSSLRIYPIQQGVENFKITASDGYLSVTSENITVNITGVPNSTIETITESGGTGTSSSSSSSTIVPYTILEEVEIEKEIYLDILNPEPVVVYGNDTLRQVILLVNNGNKTLRGIKLSAETNSSTADISFSNNYIPELLEGETAKTDLIIVDYQIYNKYEIVIYANVSEPNYNDKAVIYINALEKSRGNQSVTSTKITFAQDLLSSNPECVELNEFLKKARGLMEQGNYEEAAKITDSIIQGCKYLVSQSKLRDERPSAWVVTLGLDKNPYLKPVLIFFVIIVIASTVLTIRLKKANEKLEQE